MLKLAWIAVAVLGIVSPVRAQTQRAYTSFEIQMGAQVPLSSIRNRQAASVERTPGVSLGMLGYHGMDDPIFGLRLRGDIALNYVSAQTADANQSKLQTEYSFGVDASPRISRIAVRDVEARFYAGVALRVVYIPGTDCLSSSGTGGNPWCYDVDLIGSPLDVVGRAGWFIRRKSKASLLRLDIAYQFGPLSITRHEFSVRVGVGSY